MNPKIKLALRSYHNPACSTIDDFKEDYRRASHVKRLLNDYRVKGKPLKVKLVINHIIALENVFESEFAWVHLRDTVGDENYVLLNTFMYYLKRTFDVVDIDHDVLASIKKEVDQ